MGRERNECASRTEEPQRYVSTYSVRASLGARHTFFYSISVALAPRTKVAVCPALVLSQCSSSWRVHVSCTFRADVVVLHIARMNRQSGSTMLSAYSL